MKLLQFLKDYGSGLLIIGSLLTVSFGIGNSYGYYKAEKEIKKDVIIKYQTKDTCLQKSNDSLKIKEILWERERNEYESKIHTLKNYIEKHCAM